MPLPGFEDAVPFDPVPSPVPQDPPPQDPVPSLRDRILERHRQQAETERSLILGRFEIAAKHDPATRAEAQRTATQLGLDPGTAETNRDVLSVLLKRRQLEQILLAEQNPVLGKAVRNIEFARIAHNDLANLSETEKIARNWEAGQLLVERGRLFEKVMRGAASAADRERIQQVEERMAVLPPPSGFISGSARILGQMSVTLPDALSFGVATGLTFGGAAAIAGQAGPQALAPEEIFTVPGAAVAGLTLGTTTRMAQLAYQTEAGNAYADMLGQGIEQGTAALAATGVGVANMVLEMVGVAAVAKGAGLISKPIRDALGAEVRQEVVEALVRPTIAEGAKTAAKGYLTGLGGEVVTETMQETVNVLAEQFAGAGTLSTAEGRREAVSRVVQIAVETAQGMALLAAPGPAVQFRQQMQRARAAEHQVAFYEALSQQAEASETRKHNPAMFGEFVADATAGTPVADIYVDGVKFAEAVQSSGMTFQQLEQEFPELAAQVDRVQQNATIEMDVVIPTGQFAEKIAGTPLAEALKPHVRFTQDGMSFEESQAWLQGEQQLAEEAASLLPEQQAAEREFRESGKRVEDRIYEQVTATGRLRTAREARTAAAVYRAFYETQARDVGLSPEQFYEQFPVAFEAATGEPAATLQHSRGEFDPSRLVVRLFERADLTTTLHEGSHFFLHVYGQMAQKSGATPRMAADMQTLLDWFGVESVEAWNALSLEEQRKHHERFAYSFEGYLFDGKAPSEELRGLFDRIRRWFREVYRAIRETIGATYRKEFGEELPILTGEVRAVMDRMLAAEHVVRDQVAVRDLVPLFQSREQFPGTDEEWAAYQDMDREWRDAAIGQLERDSLRQMEWLSNARGRLLKEMQGQHEEVRRGVRAQVVNEVWQRPEYAVPRFIKTGEVVQPDGTVLRIETDTTRKLNRAAVERILDVLPPSEVKDGSRGVSLVTFIRQMGGISHESWFGSYPGERGTEHRPAGIVQSKKPRKRGAKKGKGETKAAQAKEGLNLEATVGGGGMAWDHMADLARDAGYGPPHLRGISRSEETYEWFIDAITDAAQGQHTYPSYEFRGGDLAKLEQEMSTAEPPSEAKQRQILRKEILGQEREAQRRRKILAPFRGMLDQNGVLPDEMAETFAPGMTGEALVRAIADARNFGEAVDARTDERMWAEHAEFADPAEVEAAVERALHNEARARMVGAELRMLEGAERPVRTMLAAAREAARQAILRMPVAEVTPTAFAQAEARAARMALEATRTGKTDEAIAWKRKQMLQGALAREAGKFAAEKEKWLRNLSRFSKADSKLAKSRDVDLVNAARWILGRYGLATPAQEATAARAIAALQAYDPALLDSMRPLLDDAERNGRDYRALTVEQFQDLSTRIDGLWNTARRTHQIRVGGKLLERAQVRDQLVEQLRKAPPRPTKDQPIRRAFGAISAWFRHAESWALEMDGGTAGPVHRFLFRLLREPYDAYLVEKAAMVNELQGRVKGLQNLTGRKIEARHLVGKDGKRHVFRNRGELIGWLLHQGNADNMRQDGIARGFLAQPGPDAEVDLSPVLREIQAQVDAGNLTRADFDFVQGVWDTFEHKLKKRAQQAHKDNYGHYFEEIAARPLTVTLGGEAVTYRGGYMPAKADPDLEQTRPGEVSLDGLTEASADVLARHPSAPKGFTIARTGADRALAHDIRLVAMSFAEELQFIHMQRAGRDIASLLSDREVQELIGKDTLENTLLRWLKDTMRDRLMAPGGDRRVNGLLTAARRNVGLGYMFANVVNAVQQLTGVAASAQYVPLKYLRGAVLAARSAEARQVALDKSKTLALRVDKNVGQIVDDIDVLLEPTWLGRAQAWTRKHGYFMQRWFQVPVDFVTWMGAYDHGIAQGMVENDAVAHADSVLRRSQGSAVAADLSALERGSAFVRLLTQFGGFWFAQTNTVLARHGEARVKAFAAAVLFQGLAAGVLAQAMRGGWDDDDEDGELWDDVVTWAFGEAMQTGAQIALPIVGPMVASDRRLSPGAVWGAGDQAKRALFDLASVFDPEKEWRGSDVRDFGMLFQLLGVPTYPLARPASYALDVEQGNVTPRGPFDYARGLSTGSAAPGTR